MKKIVAILILMTSFVTHASDTYSTENVEPMAKYELEGVESRTVETQYKREGNKTVKISTEFKTDMFGKVSRGITCTGTCAGGNCNVVGCDPQSNFCDKILCGDGNCTPSCSKTSTSSRSDFFFESAE